jgi:ABC-type multidrug transport system permease subunit
MNITWYWGNSSANATHYLGSTLSVINGTYSMAIVPANQTYTDYWWNVNVTSGTDYAVGIYNFKTSVKSGGIIVADKKFVLGLCIGILLFFVLVMVMRSRKRND